MNGLNTKNEISAYPNPCSSVLNINTDNIESILIYSLHGVLMTELNNDSTVKISSKIDISKLPNGIYLLRARAIDSHLQILKFQVSH
jgi:hypothetical protein